MISFDGIKQYYKKCLLLDIDYFKRINDTLGHRTGNCVFTDVTKIIYSQLRAIDALARCGGEEFSVLLTNRDKKKTRWILERIRECIASYQYRSDDRARLKVAISIGVATLDRKKSGTTVNYI